jgi:hypothetical protein
MARGKSSAAGGETSQREMVKTALEDLGDVGPTQLQEHILQKYGKEIKKQIISSYKSQLKSGKAGGGTGVTGRGAGKLSGSVDVRDIAAVQNLIRRIGAGQLQSLIKMLIK